MTEDVLPPNPYATNPPAARTSEEIISHFIDQVRIAMSEHVSPPPIPSQEREALQVAIDSLTVALKLAVDGGRFPLDKRETFAAFLLMGLASRLQPIQASNPHNKKVVIDLSFELADMAVAKSKPEP